MGGFGSNGLYAFGTSIAGTLALLLVLGESRPASATIPPEIPITSRLGVGARAMGMGGAGAALADDYHALYYNPASLVQARDTQFGGVFTSRSVESTTRYFDNVESTPLDETMLQSVGFTYAYPTYRGSLAIALSYEKVTPFDFSYYRSSGGIGVEEIEEVTEDAALGAYQAGFAWELSPMVALGFTGTILAGSSTRTRLFEFHDSNGIDRELTNTTTEMDLNAITGSLGVLYSFHPDAKLAFVLHFPENFDLEGTIEDDVIRYQSAPPETLDYIDNFSFSDELKLPLRVTVGGGYTFGPLAVGMDVTWADWKEIDYYGPIRGDDRDFAYRSTVDLRLGAEYTIPNAPVRLRAGYLRQPTPYDLVGVDVFRGEAERATFDRENQFITLGAGVDLDEALTFDVAYLFGGSERSGRSARTTTVEEIDESRLLLSATFRMVTR